MSDTTRTMLMHYGGAVLATGLALSVRFLLDPWLGDHLPFVTFFVAVAVAAWLGGLRSAALATLVGFVLAVYFFVPPRFSLATPPNPHLFGLAMYFMVSVAFAGLGEAMHVARRRAEAGRELLLVTLASIGDAVIATDAEGRVTFLNAKARDLTGWSPEDARGKPLTDVFRVVGEQHREPVDNPVETVLKGGQAVGVTNHTILVSRGGTQRPIEESGAPIRDASGGTRGVVLVFRDVSEKKRAEEVRRRLAAIVESSDDAIISKSLDGTITSWNSGAERVYGYSAAEVLGQPFSMLIPPDRAAEMQELARRLQEGKRHDHFETVRRRKDGTLFDVSVSYSPIRDDHGEVIGTAVITRDISAKKRAEEQLRESEQELADFFENATIGLHWVGPDGTILRANRAELELLGYSEEEYIGRQITEFHVDEDVICELLERLAAGERLVGYPARLRCKDGSIKDVLIDSSVFWKDGQFVHTRCFTRDVTDQKRAEEGLRDRERQLQLVTDHAPVLIAHANAQNRYKFVNKAYAERFGLQPQQIVGKSIPEVLGEAAFSVIAPHVEAALAGQQVEFEAVVPYRDLGPQHMHCAYQPEFDANGRVVGYVAAITNITQRKRVEQELAASERRFRTLTRYAPVGIFLTDAEGNCLFVNERWCEMAGMSGEAAQGAGWIGALHPEDRERIVEEWGATVKGRREFASEYRLRTPGGQVRWLQGRASPLRSAAGEIEGYVGTLMDITERRNVEQDLRLQARVLESMAEGVSLWDEEGLILYTNPAEDRMFGYQPGELLGQDVAVQNTYRPEENQRIINEVIHQLGAEGAWSGEFNNRKKDGTPFTTFARITTLDAGGKRYFVCVQEDITERKLARAALEESEQRFRQLAEHITDVFWMADPAKPEVLYVSPAYEHIWGRSCQSLYDEPRSFIEGVHPEDRERVIATLEQQARGEVTAEEYRVVQPDGSVRWVWDRGFPVKDSAGRVVRVAGIAEDITQRRNTEQALRESEERFRAAVDQAAVGVALVGQENRTLFVNRGLCEMLGYSEAELMAGTFVDVTHPDDLVIDQSQMPRLLAGEVAACRYEKRYLHKNGSVVWGDLSVSAVRDEQGSLKYAVGVLVDITDRKRAEEALRESEATLRAFYENSPIFMGVTEPTAEGDILHIYDNGATCRFFGIAAGDTANRRAFADLGADAAAVARWLECYRVSESTGEPVYFEHEHPTPNGPRWLSATVCPIGRGPSGRTRFCYVAEDVTERRRRQEELRKSEERLRLALEAGCMGVWDWNLKTDEIWWSDNLEPIHGIQPGTFGGTLEAFQQLVHTDDREAVNEAIRRCLEEQSSYDIEFRVIWPNGGIHWMSGKGQVLADDGRPARMIGIGMDITQRKRSEQDARFLADASAAFATVMDEQSTLQKLATLAVPRFGDWCAVDMIEPDGSLRRLAVAHVDPAKVRLAHDLNRRYPPDPNAPVGAMHVSRTGQAEISEEISDSLLEAVAQDEEHLRILRELGLTSYLCVPMKTRGRILGVLTFVAAESGRRYGQSDLELAEELAGRAAVAVENARLYSELREADRRKDEFLATLAHELRNPLAPIRNTLQILKMPVTDRDILDRSREMMERQVQHLIRLVDDLLDVSRVMRGKVELKKERVDLAAIIARAVETAQPVIDGQGHELTITLPPQPVYLEADPVRLAQVVGNLLNNAAKYTHREGRIWLSAAQEGQEAVLTVRDNGIGIIPEMLPTVFDLFVQVNNSISQSQGGLGIGLTLAKNLVEKHGGTLEARSEGLNKGSEFVIRLPLPDVTAAGVTPAEAGPAEFVVPKRRVLVVDDNVDAAESLAMLLRLNGSDVRVAHSGPAALKTVQAFRPDLVFLDLGMPVMNGYEVARRMRRDLASDGLLLVALTGWGQEEDRRRTREVGFDMHLVKPVEPSALNEVLSHPKLPLVSEPDWTPPKDDGPSGDQPL